MDPAASEALDRLDRVSQEKDRLDIALRLASAAVRLHPQDRARATLARALSATGQFLTARRLAVTVLDTARGTRASLAWDIVGTCAYHLDGAPAALSAYERALRENPGRTLPKLIAAVMSIEAGSTDGLQRCETRLIAETERDDPVVPQYVDWLRRLRRSGRWNPRVASDALRTWMESRHEILRTIASAFE